MSVAPLFPEKPVKMVVPTGVSYKKIYKREEKEKSTARTAP